MTLNVNPAELFDSVKWPEHCLPEEAEPKLDALRRDRTLAVAQNQEERIHSLGIETSTFLQKYQVPSGDIDRELQAPISALAKMDLADIVYPKGAVHNHTVVTPHQRLNIR